MKYLLLQLVPGETALAFYRAKNPTDKPIVGISTYNVVPFEAGQYFNKIQVCIISHPYSHHHHTTTVLRPFFRDHLGEPVPEENFWTLWCKGRLTEAETQTIRLGATPSGLTIAHLQHHPYSLTSKSTLMFCFTGPYWYRILALSIWRKHKGTNAFSDRSPVVDKESRALPGRGLWGEYFSLAI